MLERDVAVGRTGAVAARRGPRAAAGPGAAAGRVYLAYVFLDDVLQMRSAPGGLATASGPLRSHGMVGVELYAEDGSDLSFEGTAEVRFPLAEGAPFEAGDEAPLYHWEEGDAAWTLAGTGRVEGDGDFVATVDGFSWWNCDEPAETRGCVTGRLSVGLEGADVEGAEVIGWSHRLNVVQSTSTGADGSFCLDLPEGPATLDAVHVRDDVAWTWHVEDVEVPGSGGTCGREACAVDLGTLAATPSRALCVSGEVTEPSCLPFRLHTAAGAWWDTHKVQVRSPGPFRATLAVPRGMTLSYEGTMLEAADHGASAMQPAAFGACLEVEAVERHPYEPDTGRFGTGIPDTGAGCW